MCEHRCISIRVGPYTMRFCRTCGMKELTVTEEGTDSADDSGESA